MDIRIKSVVGGISDGGGTQWEVVAWVMVACE